jgi:hypothetical protein
LCRDPEDRDDLSLHNIIHYQQHTAHGIPKTFLLPFVFVARRASKTVAVGEAHGMEPI